MSADLRRVHDAISAHLAEIAGLFVPGVKLTLLARSPSHPDGSRDMVVTSDDLIAAIVALGEAAKRQPWSDAPALSSAVEPLP